MSPQNQTLSGIVSSPCIVSFTDVPETIKSQYPDLRLLVGVLVKDFKGRFPPGEGFRSSFVQSVDGDRVITANSIYQVKGDIDYVELPLSQLTHVMAHIDPRHIRTLIDAGYTVVGSTGEEGSGA